MKDDVNDEVPNGIPKKIIPFNGMINWDGVLKSNNKVRRCPCYTFMRLDKKTYHIKFDLKMFIYR
jgi:hypothetical protein